MDRVESFADSAGFVKLPRALLLEPWARHPISLALFVHLLAKANREPKEWNGIQIERGQLVTSRRSLAKATGISEQRLRTALLELSRSGATQYSTHGLAHASKLLSTHGSTHGFTIVTINNFGSYSGQENQANPRSNPRKKSEPTHGATQKPTTTRENIRNNISLWLPDESPEFREILCDFLAYRRETGKPITAKSSILTNAKRLKKLSADNMGAARRIVENTIANGWQGLFPLNESGGAPRRISSTRTAADRLIIDKNDQFKTTF